MRCRNRESLDRVEEVCKKVLSQSRLNVVVEE
jgi:hypothetical protein